MSSVTAARARVAPLALVRAVPTWLWLVCLVALSVAVRYAFARRMVAPWIMVDELIYSELAKSFAAEGRFSIRDVPAGGSYGVVYPLLISPAYALFDAVPTAYACVKAINAVLMSLTAVPTYLIARRLVAAPLALVAAALSVVVPSTLYAGTVMTENAFYPAFTAAALALVRVLERPTVARTLVFLAAAGVAFSTRAQGIVLVPALLTAPLLLAVLGGDRIAGVRAFGRMYATAAAGGALALAGAAAAGRTPAELLGAYRSATELEYTLGSVVRWFVYHVAEFDLYLGIVPFAALVLLTLIAPRLSARDRVFVAAALSLSSWLLLLVAAFASTHTSPPRIEERNAFYVAPLFLIALVVWIDRGLPRPRVRAFVAAVVAALLPAVIPYASLISVSAQSDTFALLPLWSAAETFDIPLERLWLFVAGGGALLALLFLRVPRAAALALPAAVAVVWAASLNPIEAGTHGIRRASIGALFQGITHPDRNWIDAATPRGAEVAVVWSGRADVQTIWQNEFFSRSVGPVYSLAGRIPGGLHEEVVAMERSTGRFFTTAGAHVQASYVLAEADAQLDGRRVAADVQKGLVVLRTPPCTHDVCAPGGGEVRGTRLIEGLYDDLWSGRRVSYTHYRCRGGTLSVLLDSDPKLFRRPQTVLARVAGRVVASASVPPAGTATLRLRLRRGGAGSCKATFLVPRTAVPAKLQRGSTDTRALGVHFRRFTFRA